MGRPWIELAFVGNGWSRRTIASVLGDLRADLGPRQIDLDLSGEHRGVPEVPIAWIRISHEGPDAVTIEVDISEAGTMRKLSRVTALDAVPPDGRTLAIALTAGELLRVGWVQIALLRAAERASAPKIQMPRPSDTAQTRQPRSPPTQSPQQREPAQEAATVRASPPPQRDPNQAAPSVRSPSVQPPESVQGVTTVRASPPPQQAPAAPQAKNEQSARPVSEATRPAAIPNPESPGTTVAVAGDLPAPARFHLGVAIGGAFFAAAPTGTSNIPMSPGLALRLALTGQRLGISVGALLPTDVTLDLGDAEARERRMAFDAGARLTWRWRQIAVATDLGALGVYRRIDGVGLVQNNGASGFDVGVRGGVGFAFVRSRVTPWIGVAAEVVPVPAAISFAPAGTAGHAPLLWVGIAAGLSVRVAGTSSQP